MAPERPRHPGAVVLAELYAAVGEPGYAAIATHSEYTTERSVTKATVHNVLNGRTRPQPGTVTAIVAACLAYAGKHRSTVALASVDPVYWLDRYRRAVAAAVAAERATDPVLATYLDKARTQFRAVQLSTLTPLTDPDEHPAMSLGEVFIAPSVRKNPPPIELPREVWRRLAERGHLRDGDLPTGLDRTSLDRLHQAYRRRRPEPVLSALARPSATRLVLLGDPGSGKTTLARYLALVLAGGAGLPDELAPLTGVPPVVIELRVYISDTWGDGDFLDLLDFQHAHEGFGLPRRTAQRLFTDSPSLVVFDGLDEVFDPEQREAISRRIAGFATQYPLARVIVTSRRVGYERTVLDTAGFTHYLLEDLDRKRIGMFVDQWYTTAFPGDEQEARRLHDRLLTAIDGARPVAELAGNPMLLTILAIISRRRELPRDRREVYDHAVTVLVEQWDISKHLADRRVDQSMPYIDRRAKVELLHRVARRMQDAPAGLAGNHIPGHDLTDEFEHYLRDTYELPRDRAKTVANAMLDQFRQRNFILSRFGTGVYGFVHRAFLEYLAADDIVQRFGRHRKLSEQDLVDIFTRRWSDAAWHEVLRHIAGMLEEEFVGPVIDHLLELHPAWRQSADTLPDHLVLAVQCLGEVRRLGMLTRQSERVAAAITDMLVVANFRHRQYSTELAELIEQKVLPALSAFSAYWAGAETYRAWFSAEQENLARHPGYRPPMTLNLATRIRAVLRRDGEDLHERFLSQLASPNPALRISAISGLTALCGACETTVRELCRVAEADAHAQVRVAAVEAIGQHPSEERVRDLLMRRAETDAYSGVRATAVEKVAAVRPHSPEVADWLRRIAADSPDHRVRSAAIAAMDVEAAGPDVLAWLRDRVDVEITDQARSAAVAAVALGWATDPAVSGWLRELAEQAPSSAVRSAAVSAVAEHGRHDQGMRDWLMSRARLDIADDVRRTALDIISDSWLNEESVVDLVREYATKERNEWLRATALRAVGAVSETPGIREWLQQVAASGGTWHLRQDAIRLVAQHWGTEPEIRSWLRAIAVGDPNALVRADAMGEVLKHSTTDDTLTWLKGIAESDTTHFVRGSAVTSVAAGWLDQPATVSWLREKLATDPSWQVRAEVNLALSSIALLSSSESSVAEAIDHLHDVARYDCAAGTRSSAIGNIAEWFADEPSIESWLRTIAGTDRQPQVRSAAVREVAAAFESSPDLLDWLRTIATTDGSSDVRREAIREISSRSRYMPEVLSWLKAVFARDHEPQVRESVINVMTATWAAHDWLAEPGLIDWLMKVAESDRDGAVRAAAITAVADCRVQRPGTLDWLIDRLADDTDEQARVGAVRAVAHRWPAHGTRSLLESVAADDASGQVRAAALAAIADSWGHEDGMLDRLMRTATTDPDPYVREEAVAKVVNGWYQRPGTLGWVKAIATSDAAGAIRRTAVWKVAEMWPNHPETHDWLRWQAAHSSQPSVRADAVRQLGHGWANRAETLPWLRRVGETDQDALVRIAAIEAVTEYGALDPSTPHWVRERVTVDDDPTVQAFTVIAAAESGQLLPDTPQWLRDVVATDAHWHCRSTAVEVLASAWLRDRDGLRWLRQVAESDRDLMVRGLAAEMVSLGWAHEPDVVGWLKDLASTAVPGVACALIRSIAAALPLDVNTVPWLRTFAGAEDEAVRRTASRELEHLASPTDTFTSTGEPARRSSRATGDGRISS